MFDSIDVTQIPVGPLAVAGYVDGAFQTMTELAARFPHALRLSIAVSPAHDADCLDVETGDASPAEVPGWYDRQRARGVARPCIYANASTMQAGIIPLVRSGRIARPLVRLWSAHYSGQHICAPHTCGAVSIGMDGCQWTDSAWGRDLDESLLVADFFAVPVPPKPAPVADPTPAWQEAIMNKLPVLAEGAADHAGAVCFVQRLQALVKVYGEFTGMAEVACQETTGTFDATTAANVRAVQAHAGITADQVAGPMTWGVLVTGAP